MSYCKEFNDGKDKVMFVTKEDHSEPSTVELPPTEQAPGLILPSGDINWNCPCLGGMATGPCGVEFREAFSCFHYSESEPKGSDCFEKFKTMQDCFSLYPTVYNKNGDSEDNIDLSNLNEENDDENSVDSVEADTKEKSIESNNTNDKELQVN